MTLLVQHGYGKSDKIERALDAGYVTGAVIAAKSEMPDNAVRFLSAITDSHEPETLLFDPQFHISTVTPANYGKLPRYPYFLPGLSRRDFLRGARIHEYVRSTLDYQRPLATTGVVAPSIRLRSFSDNWSQVALQLADASVAYWGESGDGRPLFVPIIVDETALDHRADMDAYLDILTLLECHGFYVIVARAAQVYSARYDPGRLAALMYLSFVLQQINGFEVIGGYSDLPGILQIAAGAESIATGWFQSLRYFCVEHLRPRKYGRQPRPRYTSRPALESILIADLGRAYETGVSDSLLTGTAEDAPLRTTHPDRVPWPRDVEVLHHWASLSSAVNELAEIEVSDALSVVREWLDSAEDTIADARLSGVEFEPTVGTHIENWRDAMEIFEEACGLG